MFGPEPNIDKTRKIHQKQQAKEKNQFISNANRREEARPQISKRPEKVNKQIERVKRKPNNKLRREKGFKQDKKMGVIDLTKIPQMALIDKSK